MRTLIVLATDCFTAHMDDGATRRLPLALDPALDQGPISQRAYELIIKILNI